MTGFRIYIRLCQVLLQLKWLRRKQLEESGNGIATASQIKDSIIIIEVSEENTNITLLVSI